jgi:CelD/BcsL family acetyltransferase involved in cellulose biosynthesis
VQEHQALEVVAFDRLSESDLAAWQRLRDANPSLDSPYFHPGFASSAHATFDDVVVAVARGSDSTARLFLPLQTKRGVARPAGWPAADFQAPIAAPGETFDPRALLRTGEFRSFAFDHLLDGSPGFEPWIELRHQSPLVDITGGLDGYLERASRKGRQNIQESRRRTRKLEVEYGSMRFVAESDDNALLEDLVRLKRAQYRATGAPDYFGVAGRRELLEALLRERRADFGGILSGLYAGDRLVAAHLGLRSKGVLHWWFPVYDPELARFGPGWMLLREMMLSGPTLGLSRIDLGRGDDMYKRHAKTGEVAVSEGRVESGSLGRRVRAMKRRAGNTLRESRLGPRGIDFAKQVRTRVRGGGAGGSPR